MYAAFDKNKPIAIVVPVEVVLKQLAKDSSVNGHGIEDLVHSEKLNRVVLKQLQEAGKAGGLAGIEIIDSVVLADDEWTPANVSSSFSFRREPSTDTYGRLQGLTTAAQKINRKGILQKYQKDVDKAYSGFS